MNRSVLKIVVAIAAVGLVVLAGLFFAGVFEPGRGEPVCEEDYVNEYGGADCEAITDQGDGA